MASKEDANLLLEDMKLTQLEQKREKVIDVLSKIKAEIHALDVEWLHLRGLVISKKVSESNTNSTNTPPLDSLPVMTQEKEINYDDVNAINATEFNYNALDTVDKMARPDLFSSESENDSPETESEEFDES